MALFDTCMEFENYLGQMTSFQVLLQCHSLTLSKKCLRLRLAPSKCLSERINWIISRIPRWISKNIFVQGSYESLAMLEGKTRKGLFFQGLIWYNIQCDIMLQCIKLHATQYKLTGLIPKECSIHHSFYCFLVYSSNLGQNPL